MKSKIVAFDHADSALAKVMKLCGIPDVADLHKVEGAEIAICHIGDNEDAWKTIISKSKAGSIRIRTSSVGRSGFAHEIRDGVIILELQLPHDPEKDGGVTKDQWNQILDALKTEGTAAQIVQGDVPVSLVKFFGRSDIQFLLGLSILCQGYLAVQVGPDGAPELLDPGNKIVGALKLMGWNKVLSSEESMRILDPRLTAKDRADRVSLRNDAADPSFWDVLTEPQEGKAVGTVSLLKNVWREWGPARKLEDSIFVEKLVNKIETREDQTDATLVAEAYLELDKRLGRTNAS